MSASGRASLEEDFYVRGQSRLLVTLFPLIRPFFRLLTAEQSFKLPTSLHDITLREESDFEILSQQQTQKASIALCSADLFRDFSGRREISFSGTDAHT
jgi:hypothetical protein